MAGVNRGHRYLHYCLNEAAQAFGRKRQLEYVHTTASGLGGREMSHGHGGADHGPMDSEGKRIAILISILALLLAIGETLGKSAQTNALAYNIEASNLWAFYQAKTIRKTTMETAAEQMEVDLQLAKDPAVKALLAARVKGWKDRAARYESEPKPNGKGEGRKELAERAKHAEELSHKEMEKYHKLEISSAAFQIAIVLASSYLITKAIFLLFGALGLGGIGILMLLIGTFAPTLSLFGGGH